MQVAAKVGDLDRVKFFIENGIHIDQASVPQGLTALHHAAQHGHIEVVKYLVEKGANINARGLTTKYGELAAADKAAIAGHEKIVAYFKSVGVSTKFTV